MFRFVCNSNKNLLNGIGIGGDSPHNLLLLLLLPQTPFLKHLSSTPAPHSPPSTSFTLSYLIHSCGLSPDQALAASTKVTLLTPSNPDSVLALLRAHRIPDPHISKLIQTRPSLLASRPHTTLSPKLHFFTSLGVTPTDLPRVILCRGSLANTIIPSVAFLKTLVTDHAKLLLLLTRSLQFLQNPHNYLIPNVELLRAHGVPDSNIAALLVNQPRSFLHTRARFREIVELVERVGFNPKHSVFVMGVQAMACMSDVMRRAKFEVYKKWGWSEDDVRRAFRAEPMCMMLSRRMITEKMNFFVNNLGYDPLQIAKHPRVLKYSMEKRLIPRFEVIKILNANGLLNRTYVLSTVVAVSDKKFLEMFVTKFEKVVPGLSNVYQGHKTCLGKDNLGDV